MTVAHKHIGGRGRGGGLPPVEGDDFTIRPSDQHEATAADAGIMTVNDAQHQACHHGRVNRVATLPHRLDPGLACQVMHRGDHALAVFFSLRRNRRKE